MKIQLASAVLAVIVTIPAFAETVCFRPSVKADEFAPPFCISQVQYDGARTSSGKAGLRISGGAQDGFFTIVDAKNLSGGSAELTANKVLVSRVVASCGESESITLSIKTVYDFASVIQPSQLRVSLIRNYLWDTCHGKYESTEILYEIEK